MKTLFSILFSMSFLTCVAQWDWSNKFDHPATYKGYLFIDTMSNPNNIWEVGKPQKAVFDSAYSYPNALVTDTINTYPADDTSIFILKIQKTPKSTIPGYFLGLDFRYKLDIDSRTYGKIEVSGDSGVHWIDVLKDDTTYGFSWYPGKPGLNTSTNGWKIFSLEMSDWGKSFPSSNKYPSYTTADTFLVRFTFITDTAQSNKDGWMIDDIDFEDWYEDIESVTNSNLIYIYPNPAKDYIYIKSNYSYYARPAVSISNLHGQEVYHTNNVPKNGYLKVDLPDGIYLLKYSTGSEQAVKQLIIQH